MASLNKAMLIGRLGKDPEMQYTPSGKAVTKFSIATSETWKDQSGEKQERTTWHNVVAWGRIAEVAAKYLAKGSQVFIEGRIDNRTYERDGNKRYISEIITTSLTLLGEKKGGTVSEAQEEAEAGASPTDGFEDIPF